MAKTQQQARKSREKTRELAQKKNAALVHAAGKKFEKIQAVREEIRTTMKKTWSELQARQAQKSGILRRAINWLRGKK